MMRVAATVALLSLAGCTGDGLVFYEVFRARFEECLIRANGEFCVEPDQFDPPSTEVWTVEEREGRTILYETEEVWILDVIADDADPVTTPRTATKTSVVIDGGTGCRTDTSRTIQFVADGVVFDGTLTSRSVVTGPSACGSTPVGDRSIDTVQGQVSGP